MKLPHPPLVFSTGIPQAEWDKHRASRRPTVCVVEYSFPLDRWRPSSCDAKPNGKRGLTKSVVARDQRNLIRAAAACGGALTGVLLRSQMVRS